MKITPILYTINGIGTKVYSDTLYIVFAFIPILPLARYDLEHDIDIEGRKCVRFNEKLKLHLWQRIWVGCFILSIAVIISLSFISKNKDQAEDLSLNKKFKITSNHFLSSFPVKHWNSFYLKGKILPIDMDNRCVNKNIYNELGQLKPNSIEEVDVIMQLWKKTKIVGSYSDDSKAYVQYYLVKFIDITTKTEVYTDVIWGSPPPPSKKGRSDAYGGDPNWYPYLNKLPYHFD